jgi:two-component system KDP operon response regulator KdpE
VTDLLVVEDDSQLRKALALTLRSRGYVVTTAETGDDAVRLATTRRFDVVVLDLGLPDRDGVTVIEEVRRTHDVPIVVLSARRDQRDKVVALDAGADDCKPLGAELLARPRCARRKACSRAVETADFTSTAASRCRRRRGVVHLHRREDAEPRAPTACSSCADLPRWGPIRDADQLPARHMAQLPQVPSLTPRPPHQRAGLGYRFDCTGAG